MKKILIANRGEIACRIINSCKKLKLHSVAVYSDIDKSSKHVREADESIHIGGSKAQDSYLSSDKIIKAAQKVKADAIHPGYGFLAENDQFAQKVIDAGIIWIGPKPNTIVSMGNKDIARDLALKSDLPICPGLTNQDLEKNDLEKKCNEIGFPILVKASAGGGGIGMQIVNNYSELVKSVEKTKNLAKKAFGNSDVFLEKFIKNARHIEIQIFGFGEKKAVHFFERDCSIQRRFQKIIEESPAPKIDEKILNEMAQSAVNFASNQSYEGAGTIEFIYDVDEKKFYFLEMNTRIQVEHPVSEIRGGIDIVKEQIKIASNYELKWKQKDIKFTGHSIECRINAENPKTFMPSPGKIEQFHSPGGLGIRIDSGIYSGYNIPPYYDSLIAKLIAHGKNRKECILKLKQAIKEMVIEPIPSTLELHQNLLENPDIINGNFDIKWLEQIYLNGK